MRHKPQRRKWAKNAAAREEPKVFWHLVEFRLSVLAFFVCAFIFGLVWFWHSGFLQRQGNAALSAFFDMTKEAGFAVKAIDVHGRHQTTDAELFDALRIKMSAPLLASDLEEARARVEKLPWVATATIERRLPDVLYVNLVERQPLARWQQAGKNVVIDREGKFLSSAKAEAFPMLPLVVGIGAEEEAATLLAALGEFPYIAERVKASSRVSQRRWDLYLTSDVIAKLPETDIKGALGRLLDLLQNGQMIDRDVTAIDLRLTDRLILEHKDQAPVEKPQAKKEPEKKIVDKKVPEKKGGGSKQ